MENEQQQYNVYPQEHAALFQPMQASPIPARTPHSGLGIASFIISIVGFCVGFMLVIAAALLVMGISDSSMMTSDEMVDEAPGLIIVGLLLISVLIMNFVGLILGIVSLVQSNRKKIFPILGTVFNSLTFIGLFGLIVIGNLTG